MNTDPIELAQVVAALLGMGFTTWALRRALRDYRDVHGDTTNRDLVALQPAALRRVRQQAFTLAKQLVLVTVGLITLARMTTTEQTMSVRGFAMAAVSILLLLRSALDHWEQRTIDRAPYAGPLRRRTD